MGIVSLNSVTPDIAFSIFGYLSPRDLTSVGAVSEQCRKYAFEDFLWQKFSPNAPSGLAREYLLCEFAWSVGRAVKCHRLHISSFYGANIHLQSRSSSLDGYIIVGSNAIIGSDLDASEVVKYSVGERYNSFIHVPNRPQYIASYCNDDSNKILIASSINEYNPQVNIWSASIWKEKSSYERQKKLKERKNYSQIFESEYSKEHIGNENESKKEYNSIKKLCSIRHPPLSGEHITAMCATNFGFKDTFSERGLVLTGSDSGKVYYGRYHDQNEMEELSMGDENAGMQINYADFISSMAVSCENDGRLVVGTSGGRVSVIDIERGTKLNEFIGSCSCTISSVCSNGMRENGLIVAGISHNYSGNGHGALGISWDLRTKARIHTYFHQNHKRMHVSSDGNQFPKVKAGTTGPRLCIFNKERLYAFDIRKNSSCIFDFQQKNENEFQEIANCDLNQERLAIISKSTKVSRGYTSLNIFDFRKAVTCYHPSEVSQFLPPHRRTAL